MLQNRTLSRSRSLFSDRHFSQKSCNSEIADRDVPAERWSELAEAYTGQFRQLYECYLQHARTDAQYPLYYASVTLCDGRVVVWSEAKEVLFRLLNTDSTGHTAELLIR